MADVSIQLSWQMFPCMVMVSLLEIIWQALGQFCTIQYSLGNQKEATFVPLQ